MLPYWNPYKEDGSLALQDDGSLERNDGESVSMDGKQSVSNRDKTFIYILMLEATPIKNLTIRSQLSADYGHTTSFYRRFSEL